MNPAGFLQLDPTDVVAVALTEQAPGSPLPGGAVTAVAIPAGHKAAIRTIAQGEQVTKYGQVIGVATTDILPGQYVHTHNLAMLDYDRDFKRRPPPIPEPPGKAAFFDGFRRADGSAATRNYVGIVTTVNCSASVANYIADGFCGDALAGYPSVDGVVALTHGSGCCMGAEEEGMIQLQRTLAGFARHPNFGGVLLLGLGCETNQVAWLQDLVGDTGNKPVHAMTIQELGGTATTVQHGRGLVREILQDIGNLKREAIPASELVVGLECGGSDGYSGISANPALGVAADMLVAHGGTAILSETPEIYGAEHLLAGRAASDGVAADLNGLIRWWEAYAKQNNSRIDNNPTHGNKAGGLTTILEKSLGAIAKAGKTALNGVYRYAEPVTDKGLVFMDSPGYDPPSITGMVASGANLVAFTTGRGSVYGCKPSPSLKIATNSALYQRMAGDMDINAGRIIDGEASVDEIGKEIFERLLATASGQPTRSEAQGFGDDEFVPWVPGAQM